MFHPEFSSLLVFEELVDVHVQYLSHTFEVLLHVQCPTVVVRTLLSPLTFPHLVLNLVWLPCPEDREPQEAQVHRLRQRDPLPEKRPSGIL